VRRRAERFGRWAELAAVWRLRLKGFRILHQRYRSRAGEIDLIARRGNLLVFVEVKARGDIEAAAYAISPRQRRRIIRAGESYIAAKPQLAALDLRFDAVLVAPWRLPIHLPGAWNMD
jgi:putative endonuclease